MVNRRSSFQVAEGLARRSAHVERGYDQLASTAECVEWMSIFLLRFSAISKREPSLICVELLVKFNEFVWDRLQNAEIRHSLVDEVQQRTNRFH